jgi:hypothetical protein
VLLCLCATGGKCEALRGKFEGSIGHAWKILYHPSYCSIKTYPFIYSRHPVTRYRTPRFAPDYFLAGSTLVLIAKFLLEVDELQHGQSQSRFTTVQSPDYIRFVSIRVSQVDRRWKHRIRRSGIVEYQICYSLKLWRCYVPED